MSRLTKEQILNATANKYLIIGGRIYGKKMFAKMVAELLEYKNIEEEIGIDLIVREKALNDGFYYIDHQGNIIRAMNYISNRSYGFVCAEYDTISYYEVSLGELRKECQFYYTDYGKKQHGGWALTKEELTNE